MRRVPAFLLAATMLAGCASAPTTTETSSLPWLDREFQWDAARVTVSRQELFKLDPELEARLAAPEWRGGTSGQRLRRLLVLILGSDGKDFAYRAGHSTVAAQTWRDRSGDCLSLTVLAYSAARRLGMEAAMQEVQVPSIYGRAGELDVVNQHVNVLLPNVRTDLNDAQTHDVVVDFEPELRAPRRGNPLTDSGILARYYNNVAVESMARGDNLRAYAHFKAAIATDPGYASPYSNLAVLYRRAGHDGEAESLLRHAVSLREPSDAVLHELHRLLVDENRVTEAQAVARQLEARRSADPYYWMGVGLRHLVDNEVGRAIAEFERARDIAPGFPEVHNYLAIAYARNGDMRKARDEIDRMAHAGGSAEKVGLLKRKLDRTEEQVH